MRDRAAVPVVLEGVREDFPRIGHVWVDQGYTGARRAWIEEKLGWTVEVVQHPPTPRDRWVPTGEPGGDPRPFVWERSPPAR